MSEKCKHDREILDGYVCNDCLRDPANWSISSQMQGAGYFGSPLDQMTNDATVYGDPAQLGYKRY